MARFPAQLDSPQEGHNHVRMPDGTIVKNVPTGTTQSELRRRVEKTSALKDERAGIFARTPFAASVPGGDPTSLSQGELGRVQQQNIDRLSVRDQPGREFVREVAPAIGATLATLGTGGAAAVPAVTSRLVPTLGRSLLNIASKPVNLAGQAARAGAGGATAAAVVAPEGGATEAAQRGFKEQAGADTLSRLTLGLGKVLLRPAGKLTDEALRLIEFARKEKIDLDPGLAANKLVPKVVSNFIKGFFGSRLVSQAKQRRITRHITADSSDGQAFFQNVIGKADHAKILDMNRQAAAALVRLAGKSNSPVIRGIANQSAEDGLTALMSNGRAAAIARSKLGVDEFNGMVRAHLQNMMKRSSKSIEGVGLVIDGGLLKRELDQVVNVLSRHVDGGKSLINRLEGLAVYAKAHGEVPIASQEALINTAAALQSAAGGALIGGATAGLAVDPLGIAGGAAAATSAFAWQMFNPNSVVSKWLTTGLVPKVGGLASGLAEGVSNLAVRQTLGTPAGAFIDEALE